MLFRPRKIGEYVKMFWRRKGIFFLMLLVMLIATNLIIRRVPAVYESRAMIAYTSLSLPEGLSEGAVLALSQSASYATVKQQMMSRGNLATLVDRYKLYPKFKEVEDAAAYLEKEIKLNEKMRGYFPEAPESLAISFRYPDAGIVHNVMADLIVPFEKANLIVRQRAIAEAKRLNDEIVDTEARIRKIAPSQSIEMLRSVAANRATTEAATIQTQRFSLESSVESLGDREYALERNIADQKQQIDDQERLVRSRAANPNDTNPALGALYVRKSELEAQIKVFLTQYTERNPKVVSAREQLNEVNNQIEKLEAGNNKDVSSLLTPEASELRRMKQDLKRLEAELDMIRRDVKRKNQILSGLSITAAKGPELPDAATAGVADQNKVEYDRLIVRHSDLMNKQDAMMKLGGQTLVPEPMFRIIDSPQHPESPVAPNRTVLYAISVFASIFFGLLFVCLFEVPRLFLLNDERDITFYLGAPVIALIPETTTRIERSRNRRIRWMRGLLFLLLAAAMIPALFIVINMAQVFQFLGRR